jgi:putative restriction endonuclease
VEISKRRSSGRGEYEVAGVVDGLNTTAILNLPIVIDTGSALGRISTDIRLLSQGGKPRLRRIHKTAAYMQMQRQVEALLLMPKSIREERQLLGGQPIVIASRYLLQRIEVAEATVEGPVVVFKLGGVDCTNDSGTETIDFRKRIQQIQQIYERADDLPAAISTPLKLHRDSIMATHVVRLKTEELVEQIVEATETSARDSDTVLIPGEDPVPLLLDMLGAQPSAEMPPPAQIDPQDIEIRRRVADRWRLSKDRGSASTQFRRAVRKAYNSTCLFCGLTLPTSDEVRVPGVDAAHIVPWADYEADVVQNGLCLCKLHHWAFDQYLLALKFDPDQGYSVILTSIAQRAFSAVPHVLAILKSVEGLVQQARLPKHQAEWPSPQMLQKLYDEMGVDL